jgi:dTDP-4-amino-4,6-dideoxygalactose transaminase
VQRDIPALLGGKPVFDDILPLARPALPKFDSLSGEMRQIFESGQITSSKYVKEFEEAVASYLNVKHVIALSSCTSGLMLAAKSLGLKGEVILPSFTFSASAHALLWNGVKPVFVDCEPDTFCISVEQVKKHLTKKTSAIMGVHIFGNPANIKELESIAKKNKIRLIFDAAHALGSEYNGKRVGGSGDVEVFSLSPSKVLTAGEGGLAATNDPKLARMIRIGRDYGNPGDYDPEYAGLSVRMTEFAALIGLRSLPGLEDVINFRNGLAKKYTKMLSKVPGISFQNVERENRSTYKMFSLLVNKKVFGVARDVLMEALAAENIQTRRYFYPPVHIQKIYKKCKKGAMKNTEKVASEIICLPMSTRMTEADAAKVCEAIERISASREEINGKN